MKRAIFIFLILIVFTSGVFSEENWVSTWGNGPQRTEERNLPPQELSGNSLRQMLRVSIGGETIRIQFSNMFGNSPVVIQAAEIAKSAGSGATVPGVQRGLHCFHSL